MAAGGECSSGGNGVWKLYRKLPVTITAHAGADIQSNGHPLHRGYFIFGGQVVWIAELIVEDTLA